MLCKRLFLGFGLVWLCLGLAACQVVDQTPVILGPEPIGSPIARVSLTPFQAQSPTPSPTATRTPAPTATPTLLPSPTPPLCQETQGRVEEKEVTFIAGQQPFNFRVYLPPCFDQDETSRYPVLYMIHGQTYQDDQWVRLGINAAADALITEEKAPPFLIVLPWEHDTYEDIYGTAFAPNLVDQLIPWIDANYPTCARRDCRAIGGLSRGGAWALHLGFSRWELFGSIGMHSTPPFIGDPGRFPIWLRAIPTDQLPRVWMDTGRKDYFIGATSEFEHMLSQYEVPHEWNLFEGTHDEVYWSAHVGDYLEWYTRPWLSLPEEDLTRSFGN